MLLHGKSLPNSAAKDTKCQSNDISTNIYANIFTARCYASAVLAMALCLSVRPSVCHKSEFY